MFKKTKKTFLSKAGRQGAPSARKPFAKKVTKASQKKRGSAISGNTAKATKKVVKNGAPLKTSKVKPNVNANTGKGFKLTGKPSIDQRLSNFFMSKSPKLKSATNSPQSAPQSYKPRG